MSCRSWIFFKVYIKSTSCLTFKLFPWCILFSDVLGSAVLGCFLLVGLCLVFQFWCCGWNWIDERLRITVTLNSVLVSPQSLAAPTVPFQLIRLVVACRYCSTVAELGTSWNIGCIIYCTCKSTAPGGAFRSVTARSTSLLNVWGSVPASVDQHLRGSCLGCLFGDIPVLYGSKILISAQP